MKLILNLLNLGRLAQSGRALPLQGRSHRFKSCSAHKGISEIYLTKNTKDLYIVEIT